MLSREFSFVFSLGALNWENRIKLLKSGSSDFQSNTKSELKGFRDGFCMLIEILT